MANTTTQVMHLKVLFGKALSILSLVNYFRRAALYSSNS